jgi:hypothetical protein
MRPTEAAGFEDASLGLGYLGRLAIDESHAAGGTFGVAAARMKLIDFCLIRQSQDQSFAGRDIERSNIINSQFRHECLLPESSNPPGSIFEYFSADVKTHARETAG